jgi:hypothetical protein
MSTGTTLGKWYRGDPVGAPTQVGTGEVTGEGLLRNWRTPKQTARAHALALEGPFVLSSPHLAGTVRREPDDGRVFGLVHEVGLPLALAAAPPLDRARIRRVRQNARLHWAKQAQAGSEWQQEATTAAEKTKNETPIMESAVRHHFLGKHTPLTPPAERTVDFKHTNSLCISTPGSHFTSSFGSSFRFKIWSARERSAPTTGERRAGERRERRHRCS